MRAPALGNARGACSPEMPDHNRQEPWQKPPRTSVNRVFPLGQWPGRFRRERLSGSADTAICGGDHAHDPLLPYGVEITHRAWLGALRADAIAVLIAMGIKHEDLLMKAEKSLKFF